MLFLYEVIVREQSLAQSYNCATLALCCILHSIVHSVVGVRASVSLWVDSATQHSSVTQRNMALSTFPPLLVPILISLLILCFVRLMASVRRFGSCSSCQLRNTQINGNGRRWKSRSAAPEWLLGSRIKAQGEDEDGKGKMGRAKAGDTSQAGGNGFLCVCMGFKLFFSTFLHRLWLIYLDKILSIEIVGEVLAEKKCNVSHSSCVIG